MATRRNGKLVFFGMLIVREQMVFRTSGRESDPHTVKTRAQDSAFSVFLVMLPTECPKFPASMADLCLAKKTKTGN